MPVRLVRREPDAATPGIVEDAKRFLDMAKTYALVVDEKVVVA